MPLNYKCILTSTSLHIQNWDHLFIIWCSGVSDWMMCWFSRQRGSRITDPLPTKERNDMIMNQSDELKHVFKCLVVGCLESHLRLDFWDLKSILYLLRRSTRASTHTFHMLLPRWDDGKAIFLVTAGVFAGSYNASFWERLGTFKNSNRDYLCSQIRFLFRPTKVLYNSDWHSGIKCWRPLDPRSIDPRSLYSH